MKGTCSICGKVIRSRKSSKRTAKANFLIAMRKHQWGEHRNTMIKRIKAGKARNVDNPALQDFLKKLQTDIGAAYREHVQRTRRARAQTVKYMDIIRPYLLPEMRHNWDILQAIVGREGGIMYYVGPEVQQ